MANAGGVPVDIVPLRPSGRDLDQIASVAARGFHDDPFFEFLEPGEVRRSRFLALFFAGVLRGAAGVELLGARRADGRLLGVSAWVRPGAHPPPTAGQARQVLAAGRAMALRPRGLLPGIRILLALEKAHPHEELWYLLLLVVDPLVQRRGIGGLLHRPGLERADEQGLDCYLETQKEANVAYYRSCGYEVVDVLRPVRRGPPLWTMRRPAS